mgnify:CR=1 FL=1
MTDGEIIALAKQLGWNTEHAQTNVMLVLFAKEVAEHEREYNMQMQNVLVQAATLTEREACAKIAEAAEPYQAADLIRSRT